MAEPEVLEFQDTILGLALAADTLTPPICDAAVEVVHATISPRRLMNPAAKSSIRKSRPPALKWGIASGQFLYGQLAGSTYPCHGLSGATAYPDRALEIIGNFLVYGG